MTQERATSTTFPELTLPEREHCERVHQAVRRALQERDSWLAFSEYQQIVLYEPGIGYYSAGAAKFGADGDFVTAPEISPLFARTLAQWLAPILAACGPQAGILELGAGSGALAAELLAELAHIGAPPFDYSILEVSAELRERQQQILTAPRPGGSTVRWLERLPLGFSGVVLANEVLDALPCERFVQGPSGLLARGVALDRDGRYADALRSPVDLAARRLDQAGSLRECYARFAQDLDARGLILPRGYGGEFIPALTPFLRALSGSLARGALLLVDYGLPRSQLYLAERAAGTLRCIRRHHAHDDPFRDPGLTDITCWVDFTAVAECARAEQLELRAFATQMAWLLEAGLDGVLNRALASAANEAQRASWAQGAKRLLLPGEMGEAVKMICLTRDLAPDIGTISMQDLRASL